MSVLLRSDVDPSPFPLEKLENTAVELLRLAGYAESELSILLVDDKKMTELNTSYRGKNKTTNVLSFPMLDDEISVGPQLLGDIVISLDTAAREAASADKNLFDHVTVLLVHGLVHLLGYDHERGDAEAKKMTARETELLEKLFQGKGPAPLST